MITSCIFCGAAELSPEHVFPKWLQRALPPVGKERYRVAAQAVGLVEYDERSVRRTIAVLEVNSVCYQCNNGWMADLQRVAKPLLLPMIKGELISLSPADQIVVAGWIAMTAAVLESDNPQTMALPQHARETIKREQRPPVGMGVRIATYAGEMSSMGWHAFGVTTNVAPPQAVGTTTIGIGSFLGQCVTNFAYEVEQFATYGAVLGDFAMVFPPAQSVTWPLTKMIGDDEIQTFARAGFADNSDIELMPVFVS